MNDQRPDPVTVIGATGTHGGAVARELLAAGYPVRALVRNPDSDRARHLRDSGAVLVTGDLDDQGSLVRAFGDAAAVYAVTTPFAGGAGEEERQGDNIIAAAERAKLPWLLLASVAAADRAPVPHFASKARIERALRASCVPWTVIAPSYFFENVGGLAGAIGEGKLPLALPADKPLHQVALTNLGALVVAVLDRREEHLSRRVEVAGDAPTPAGMARALGVTFVRVPVAQIQARSPDLAAMYAFLSDDGYDIDVPALRDRYPEVGWLRFAEWARTGALGAG
ncbi:MAG TPA: NmrA family NAD(P)-binding protein [Solirubrobacteraceae bacterium]|jgi:uncharacterized protein YbjT (DUF2867 family)|nr:NmrA family NAD(P)-binding protein [Solirubrobacteraceae bacterium]